MEQKMLSDKELRRQLHMCLLRNQCYDAALSALGYALLHEAYELNPDLKTMGCPLNFVTEDSGRIVLPEGEWDTLQVKSVDCCVVGIYDIAEYPSKWVKYIADNMLEAFKQDTGYSREVARQSFRIAMVSDPHSHAVVIRLLYCTVSTKEPTP
jgi:hypothetical protein